MSTINSGKLIGLTVRMKGLKYERCLEWCLVHREDYVITVAVVVIIKSTITTTTQNPQFKI